MVKINSNLENSMETFKSVSNYLLDISEPGRPNKSWMEGYVCGLATAEVITVEVEDKLLKWISTL